VVGFSLSPNDGVTLRGCNDAFARSIRLDWVLLSVQVAGVSIFPRCFRHADVRTWNSKSLFDLFSSFLFALLCQKRLPDSGETGENQVQEMMWFTDPHACPWGSRTSMIIVEIPNQ